MIKASEKTIRIFGVKIDNMNFDEAVSISCTLCKNKGVSTIFTPNPEIIMRARKDEKFKEILNSSSISVPDGIGLIYAGKILNLPLRERIPGFNLACAILDKMKFENIKIFLLGGKKGIAEMAKITIEKTYPGIHVCGTNHGYFFENNKSIKENAKIIQKINSSGANLLFVCLGSPLQEKWVYKNKHKLNVNLIMCLGGALDVFSGVAKRAPNCFIKLNLEWLYRSMQDHQKISRIFRIPKFISLVVGEKIIKMLKKNPN